MESRSGNEKSGILGLSNLVNNDDLKELMNLNDEDDLEVMDLDINSYPENKKIKVTRFQLEEYKEIEV